MGEEQAIPSFQILVSWFPMLLVIWAWWYCITRVVGSISSIADALREVAAAIERGSSSGR